MHTSEANRKIVLVVYMSKLSAPWAAGGLARTPGPVGFRA